MSDCTILCNGGKHVHDIQAAKDGGTWASPEMTIENAREIATAHETPGGCRCWGGGLSSPVTIECYEAVGYLAGHASRDPEVADLKKVIEERGYAFQEAQQKTLRELSAEREASARLVEALRTTSMMLTTAGYGLKDCPCGTNDHCQLHDQAAKNADLLKLYATPGHSPEGKTL